MATDTCQSSLWGCFCILQRIVPEPITPHFDGWETVVAKRLSDPPSLFSWYLGNSAKTCGLSSTLPPLSPPCWELYGSHHLAPYHQPAAPFLVLCALPLSPLVWGSCAGLSCCATKDGLASQPFLCAYRDNLLHLRPKRDQKPAKRI